MPEVPVLTGLYNIVTTFDAVFFKAGHTGDLVVLQRQRTKGLLYMIYRFNLTKDPRDGKWAYMWMVSLWIHYKRIGFCIRLRRSISRANTEPTCSEEISICQN